MSLFPTFNRIAQEFIGFLSVFLRTGTRAILLGIVYWALCFLLVFAFQSQGIYWGHTKYLYYDGLVYSLGAMVLGIYASRSSGYYGWLGSFVYGLTPVISLVLIMLAFLLYYTQFPSEGDGYFFVAVPMILWPAPLFCLAAGPLGRKRGPD